MNLGCEVKKEHHSVLVGNKSMAQTKMYITLTDGKYWSKNFIWEEYVNYQCPMVEFSATITPIKSVCSNFFISHSMLIAKVRR